ncbi:hypothetical protein SAMN04488109_4586 [Chryseolinea serpens]|uniref:Repeat domain-containing protein n=2 Tax=Chryseolinea serpens TaxID=947013 RepID=A0A1M5UC09_9BACT|nr:hypothetical protein SAMN04488109_4586 [Chryseolinea serpens]
MLGIFACSPSKDPRDTVVITQSDIDSTLVSSHTTTILGEEYRGFGTSEQKLFVLNSKGDTVVSQSDMYFDFEFRDFDGDSLKDIVVHELSNTPSVQDLLLFDRAKMTFTMVKGFNNFPDPQPIEGTGYYYSYHRSGCADNFWNSDLFYIANFKTQRVANISGNECSGEMGIVVSKVKDEQKKIVEKFPLDILEKYHDRKWGFIADYWAKNYSKFIK